MSLEPEILGPILKDSRRFHTSSWIPDGAGHRAPLGKGGAIGVERIGERGVGRRQARRRARLLAQHMLLALAHGIRSRRLKEAAGTTGFYHSSETCVVAGRCRAVPPEAARYRRSRRWRRRDRGPTGLLPTPTAARRSPSAVTYPFATSRDTLLRSTPACFSRKRRCHVAPTGQ